MIGPVCIYFNDFYFSLFMCLGYFSFYVFRVQAFLFLYSVFTCLRVLGCFRSIACLGLF